MLISSLSSSSIYDVMGWEQKQHLGSDPSPAITYLPVLTGYLLSLTLSSSVC